jgi:hypothetical protein
MAAIWAQDRRDIVVGQRVEQRHPVLVAVVGGSVQPFRHAQLGGCDAVARDISGSRQNPARIAERRPRQHVEPGDPVDAETREREGAGLVHRVEAQLPDPVRQTDILIHMAVPQRRQGVADGRQIAFRGHANRSAGVRTRVGDGETDPHPTARNPSPGTADDETGSRAGALEPAAAQAVQLLDRIQQDTPFRARQRAGLFAGRRNHGIGHPDRERR